MDEKTQETVDQFRAAVEGARSRLTTDISGEELSAIVDDIKQAAEVLVESAAGMAAELMQTDDESNGADAASESTDSLS